MSEALSIAPGTRLGRYEIVDLLDAGGMGVIYRARDPHLARDVAIKVLPESVAADANRQRRFEAEARAAGSLDHPNILVVYDVGRHQVMPFIVSDCWREKPFGSVWSWPAPSRSGRLSNGRYRLRRDLPPRTRRVSSTAI